VSRRGLRGTGPIAAIAVALALSACGGQARQDANEPSGNFTVSVPVAKFPASQRLAQHTHLVISVRNAGPHTIPNVAVTITNPRYGTAAQALGQLISSTSQPLASGSRPVWIIDRPPGPCTYSCQNGGPGGAVTAYSNTWALGSLKPGGTATFDWAVTAMKPGTYHVQYRVAAGLNGKAKAVLAGGRPPMGTFTVHVTSAPQQSYVNGNGQIVKTG
jgi:hypothetical protein